MVTLLPWDWMPVYVMMGIVFVVVGLVCAAVAAYYHDGRLQSEPNWFTGAVWLVGVVVIGYLVAGYGNQSSLDTERMALNPAVSQYGIVYKLDSSHRTFIVRAGDCFLQYTLPGDGDLATTQPSADPLVLSPVLSVSPQGQGLYCVATKAPVFQGGSE